MENYESVETNKIHLSHSFWLGKNRMRGEEGRKQEEEEEEEGEGEEDQNQGMFCLESMGILNS